MDLDPEHRRVADAAKEKIKHLISGQALKDYLEREDTKLADACNEDGDA